MRVSIGTSRGGQIASGNDPVLAAEFHARSTNANPAYVAGSGVGPDSGRELVPGESFNLNFSQPGMDPHAGRILISELYVSVSGPDDRVDWVVILK